MVCPIIWKTLEHLRIYLSKDFIKYEGCAQGVMLFVLFQLCLEAYFTSLFE